MGGCKFHLRVYLLCVGALDVYVFKDILTLFALQKYDGAALSDHGAHITNTCRQVSNFAAAFFPLPSVPPLRSSRQRPPRMHALLFDVVL